MKLRKFTKRKSATGKGYPQCQHVTGKKQCEKPVYADGRCWEHQQKSGDSVSGAKAISTRSRPAEGVGASADDPFGCNDCTHADCGKFYDHNAKRLACRAMSDNACARPSAP